MLLISNMEDTEYKLQKYSTMTIISILLSVPMLGDESFFLCCQRKVKISLPFSSFTFIQIFDRNDRINYKFLRYLKGMDTMWNMYGTGLK